MRTALRIVATVIATPLLVVLYLNIEVLAAEYGADALLSALVPVMSEFLTQGWVFALSAFFIGVAVGTWLHWAALKYDKGNPTAARTVSQNTARLEQNGRHLSAKDKSYIAERLRPFKDRFTKLNVIFESSSMEAVSFGYDIAAAISAAGIASEAHDGPLFRRDPRTIGLWLHVAQGEGQSDFIREASWVFQDVGHPLNVSKDESNTSPFFYVGRLA